MLDAIAMSLEVAEKVAETGVKVAEIAENTTVLSTETIGSMGELKLETAGSMGELKLETVGSMGELKLESSGRMENTSAYNYYMQKAKKHLERAHAYEREANALERKIQQGTEPRTKISEVRKLQTKAKSEKMAAEKCKQAAKDALTGYHNVSFTGGLGATEAKHLRGSQMISEANRKRMEASSLESKARELERKGLPGATDYRIRAKNLRSEAASLERKGKELLNS